MHITHVVRQFYPAVGGLEAVVLELASAQVSAGHSVRVITLDRVFNDQTKQHLSARESIRNIDIIRIPYFGSSRYPIAPSVMKHLIDSTIVHVHGIDFFFDFLGWTKLFHGKTLVASTHGGFFHTQYMTWFKQFYFKYITRQSARFYGAIIAISHSDEKLFYRIRSSGMLCIENGVDIGKYANASSKKPRKSIIYHGRLSSNKRLDRAIALLAKLRQIDDGWTLTIAGRPWDIEPEILTEASEQEGVSGAVEVILSPSEQALRALMGRCSLAISASQHEGFGLSAIEAMSAGLLPVLNSIPPYCDLVTHTGIGVLTNFDDTQMAAQQLLNGWRNFSRHYDKNREAVMRAVVDYDWRHAAISYERMYSDVIGDLHRTILGVSIKVGTFEKVTDLLDSAFAYNKSTMIAFANAHCLTIAKNDADFRRALAGAMVFNDGVGVDIASRVLFGAPFPENLNGTDFVPRYLDATTHRYRIYLLGSRPHVVKSAAAVLKGRYPQHCIVGHRDGYFEEGLNDEIVGAIRQSAADIILVAMGNPRQEIWLAQYLEATGCKFGFAVGALFDFMSTEVTRAPQWIQAWRSEWLYRLWQEPGRLWTRYIIGIPKFLVYVLGQWCSGARI